MAIFTHDMRHTGFPQVDNGQRDPWKMGRHRKTWPSRKDINVFFFRSH